MFNQDFTGYIEWITQAGDLESTALGTRPKFQKLYSLDAAFLNLRKYWHFEIIAKTSGS